MTKRICPSCGLGAYSADTVTTWICAQCGGPIPPSCEVEMERCKPESEIERAIEILAQMRIALGRGTAKISTTTALAFAIIALGEKQENRWIPVTERLPEELREVLVVYKDGFITTDITPFDPDVTHWRPLPEPPKEAQNG